MKMFDYPVDDMKPSSSSEGRGKSAPVPIPGCSTASSSSSSMSMMSKSKMSSISSSHEDSNIKTRQHRRDFGKSPGGIMFRQSPHPLVPPLNLVALKQKNITPGVPAYRVMGGTRGKPPPSKQPPLSRSAKKSSKKSKHHHGHGGAVHTVSSILRQGPRPITREITPHRHKLGLYSPRAQVAYSPREHGASAASRNRRHAKSPALSKCVETILSPRSAFSKASSISSGTSSAFSTPSSSPFPTPRSARSGIITPRGSGYLSYRSPRTPRTPRSIQ